MKVRDVVVAAIILGLVAPAMSAPAPSGPLFLQSMSAPELAVEQPWWATWARDRSGDGIDDAILALERQELPRHAASGIPLYAVEDGPDGLRYNVFVRFAEPPGAEGEAAVADLASGPVQHYDWAELVYVPGVTYPVVVALSHLPGVRGVELERTIVPMMEVATGALLIRSTDDFGAGARDRWRVDGDGVVIAVLDTGIDNGHKAFDATRFTGGYNATIPLGTLETDPRLTTPLNEQDPADASDKGHGTHVASLAVADHRNGTWVGAAPQAGLLDVQVMTRLPVLCGDVCGTTSMPYGIGSMAIEGLDFVKRYNEGESHLGEPTAGKARVVTMSFGEETPDPDGSSVLSHAVNRIADRDIVVVAAAGNCGPTASDCSERGNDTIPAPGAAKRAITVGAMEGAGTLPWSDDRIAGFSSRGPNGGEPKPNVVAYGVDIEGAKGFRATNGSSRDEGQVLTGTSMAAPFVAGVAALMLQGNASLSADDVKRIIIETARQVGPDEWDPAHGAGVMNAYFAVGVAVGLLDAKTTRLDELGKDIPDLRVPVPEQRPEPEATPRPMQNQPPRVTFTFGPAAPLPGDQVVFADRSHDREGQRLVSWNWDFGDATTAKGDRVVHTYERPGTYVVRLTVTDELGAAGTQREEITVRGPLAEESPFGVFPVLLLLLLVAAFVRRGRSPGPSA